MNVYAGKRVRSGAIGDTSLAGVDLLGRSWVEKAECARFEDPDLFYETPGSQLHELMLTICGDMCMRCPVFNECLNEVFEDEATAYNVYGFRAGLTAAERKAVLSGKIDKDLVIKLLTSAREAYTMGTAG